MRREGKEIGAEISDGERAGWGGGGGGRERVVDLPEISNMLGVEGNALRNASSGMSSPLSSSPSTLVWTEATAPSSRDEGGLGVGEERFLCFVAEWSQ